MVMVSWASTARRAAGKLRPGGKQPRGLGLLRGGLHDRIAPNQANQGEMAVQPRPTAALVVAEPQFLLAILMETLDAPAPMRQPQLLLQRAPIQAPREIVLRVARRSGQRAFAEQPAFRACDCPVGAVHPHATGQPL